MDDEDRLLEVSGNVISACSSGDVARLRNLLENEPYAKAVINLTKNPNAPTGKKISEKTIYAACSKGHLDIVRCLLQAGINPNVNSGSGTPVFAAAKMGHLDTVKLLVENGADYANIQGGFSPLFVACTHNRVGILKYLIDRGADHNAFTNPPLPFTACISGHLDVVKHFVEEMHFDLTLTSNGSESSGKNTLLYVACQMKKHSIVKYLLGRGAHITKAIIDEFADAVSTVIQENFKPTGHGFYHAQLKEMGLVEVPWAFFANHSSTLTRVELRANNLASLPNQLFQMASLEVLDVSQNHLTSLCGEDVLWECTNLTKLDASHNELTHIPSSIFHLPELTDLCLSYNLLERLPGDPEYDTQEPTTDVLWSCGRLKSLTLSHNHLKALPDKFGDLRCLRALFVPHNALEGLPQSCCWGSLSLVHLDASYNQLTDLPIGAASYWMHTLEKLFLSNNRITEISKNVAGLNHLTTLDLSSNMIAALPPTEYWTGQRLSMLNLADNRLTLLSHTPPPAKDRSSSSEGKRLSSKFKYLFNTNKKPSKEEAKVAVPAESKPRELPASLWASCLHSLRLENNNIEFLPDYFGSFTNLTMLNISGNADIKTLPPGLGRLHHLDKLVISGVPISNVPQHLLPGVSRGGSTKHVLAYLRTQFKNCVPYNRMKLMVVGLQGRGKTTLLSVLRDPTAPLPDNISTVGVNVADWVVKAPPEVVKRNKGSNSHEAMDVVLSTWDMAGQEVYYATHQCFLSKNTLYLVVWNVEEGEKGVQNLKPWLLNIQSRAPSSPVIIVGTHTDKLPSGVVKDLKEHYSTMIRSVYDKSGFPSLSHIQFVSCSTKEGIKELQEKIHFAAVSAKSVGNKEPIIGMQVPASYVALQKHIAEEVQRCVMEKRPPVLNQKEFAQLAANVPNSDFVGPEDLSIAAQFLHDNGVILHYNDQLKGLSNLYFIDPIWLANMLAEIITVPQRQTFVHNGILKESDVPFIFRDTARFPSSLYQQYLQLLERYEIALSLGEGQYLIPSMLPLERPIIIGLNQLSTAAGPAHLSRERVWLRSTNSTDANDEEAGRYPVVTEEAEHVRRRYKMAYIPSGFWSRLISRLLINLKRSGVVEGRRVQMMYWRRGLMVSHDGGGFLVESIGSSSAEISGVAVNFDAADSHGVDIKVQTTTQDFSAMGYIVDQLDSLIDEWFPGLNDCNIDGSALVRREVVWNVPAKYDKSTLNSDGSSSGGNTVVVFPLEACCHLALTKDNVTVKGCGISVPLTHLVPDVLLMDLPSELKIDHGEFQFNPKDPATYLGKGASGAVYKGKYRGQAVAVKTFVSRGKGGEANDDDVYMSESLFLFRDLRQEVTVLARLSHPYVVALLGVSVRPMCIALEFAPLGNLLGVLEARVEELKKAQGDLSLQTVLRMPGGVLGHIMSTKVAAQVARALEYIHHIGIIYRDLKSDNVLVWSLDPKEKVNVKLADYGICRFANPGGVMGMEGTLGYQAPETIQQKGQEQAYNEKVDIFSFGMLLYELLTGLRPFEFSTKNITTAVCNGERPLLREGNLEPAFPAMVDLMEDCWRHAPSERPAAHEILAQMACPGFLCRKHTVTMCMNQPLQKVDAVSIPPPPAACLPSDKYSVWMWTKHHSDKQLGVLDVHRGTFRHAEALTPGGRACATVVITEGERRRIWVSTLQNYEVQVYGLDTPTEPKHLWSFKMNDAVLTFLVEVKEGKITRIFAGLVRGELCIFTYKNTSEACGTNETSGECQAIFYDDSCRSEAKNWLNPVFLRLDAPRNSVKCMTFVGGNRLWCGCGNGIVVVDTDNMTVVKQIPVFVKKMALVNEIVFYGKAVWGVGSQHSCVLQWDASTYSLLCVFDCSIVDPTGLVATSDPREFEDIFDPDQAKESTEVADPVVPEQQVSSSSSIQLVSNEPLSPTQRRLAHVPRKNLTTVYRSRIRAENVTRSRAKTANPEQKPNAQPQDKSTRPKSLLVIDDTLWVGRSMGDVIIFDISDSSAHGKVLARLATEDCKKYGNKSHNKLVALAGQYVVSAQWREPIEQASDVGQSCQVLTVWELWSRERIEEFWALRDILVPECVAENNVMDVLSEC